MTNTNEGMSWRTCYMMWPKLIQSCSIIHTHNRKKHSPTHTREEELLQPFNGLSRRRRICTDSKVHYVGDHPVYNALSQQGVLDPITSAEHTHTRLTTQSTKASKH